MKKSKYLVIFLTTVFLLTACEAAKGGREDTAEIPTINVEKLEDVEPEKDTGQTSDTDSETSNSDAGENADNNETGAESEEKVPEILHFVDVFGEEYEAEILSDVPKYKYDNSLYKLDGQKLYYEGDAEYTTRLGIDVSYHQGNINWEKVAADGYEFAILRVAYRGYGQSGSLQEDKKFDEYIQGAQAAGLDVGVYIFSQAINVEEAEEEANFVLKCLQGYELQLPVVYDPESILDAEARTDNVSGEQFTANTLKFCEVIEAAGYEPMVYSNMLWEAFQFDMSQTCKYPYWYADYEPLPQTPYDFVMWQYSNTGRVSGIGGETDLDILFEKKQ